MELSQRKGVVRGRGVQQLSFTLPRAPYAVAAYLANCSYGYDSTEGIAPHPNRTTKADALTAQYATAESVLVDHTNSGKHPPNTPSEVASLVISRKSCDCAVWCVAVVVALTRPPPLASQPQSCGV